MALPKAYEPKAVEARWSAAWLAGRRFHVAAEAPGPAYAIVIPPPNITGSLHLGHALNVTLQDILVRWKRMQGAAALWLPGTDHAGIATQNVVERQLAAEGTSRGALGREAFVQRVWQWREQSGRQILEQLKHLGASCDWARERFTMDPGLSAAVREVFVRLYEEDLIYRGERLIHWCPRCETALADLEVEHQEVRGTLYHVRYPLEGAGDGHLTIATTRPETILGDTAVAVHPEDARYKAVVGKQVRLPVLGRLLPIIADAQVDPTFGTGALKVTPAHDPVDYEIGRRHGLPALKVMDGRARMTAEAGPYAGLDRAACRKRLVQDLKAQGLLANEEPYTHTVGHCYRCKTVVEPMLSPQWFVRMAPLAGPAIEAVKTGRIRLIPKGWEATYFDWLEHIKDWCISRQIWWGHQIPAWYCEACGEATVARTTPDRCRACRGTQLRQDPDVLDTWFSSALWPFTTLGWPERTPELARFYPTAVLVTSFDIIFFWVARMVMMGLKFIGDVPFRDVVIHALVRDAEGQKMSKSRGNVIDPLAMMETYGTDALRFTLAAMAAPGRDVRLSEQRIEGYRHFVNKLWNAARFILAVVGDGPAAAELLGPAGATPRSLADRWIMIQLHRTTRDVQNALDTYRFDEATRLLYAFVWHEFCDWYIEWIKPVVTGDGAEAPNREAREATLAVLVSTFDAILRLLHPVIPFVTEELWQRMPHPSGSPSSRGASLATAPYPTLDRLPQPPDDAHVVESVMAEVMGVITAVRTVRNAWVIAPGVKLQVFVQTKTADVARHLLDHAATIRRLARLSEFDVGPPPTRLKGRFVSFLVMDGVQMCVSLEGVKDPVQEKARLTRSLEKVERELGSVRSRLEDGAFLTKAPPEVRDEMAVRRAKFEEERRVLQGALEQLRHWVESA